MPGQVVQPGPATPLRRLMDRVASGATALVDGGTGTECERRGVPVLDGAWSGSGALSHPDVLREVHRDHVAAGAQVIIANTFSTHRHALEAAGVAADLEAYNRRAVELAVEARTESGEEAGADEVVVAAGISSWTWTGAPRPSTSRAARASSRPPCWRTTTSRWSRSCTPTTPAWRWSTSASTWSSPPGRGPSPCTRTAVPSWTTPGSSAASSLPTSTSVTRGP